MNIKNKLLKLKQEIIEISQKDNSNTKIIKEDPLGLIALHDSIEKLIESKRKLETDIKKYRKKEKEPDQSNLDERVNNFINWYIENQTKTYYNSNKKAREMKNFIEKMAVWYELKYPNDVINQLIPYTNEKLEHKNQTDEKNSFKYFINSLSIEEKYLLSKPKYRDIVYIDPEHRKSHLHLTSNGFVIQADNITKYTKSVLKDEQLKGLHIRRVIELFKERAVNLPENNELEKEIEKIAKDIYQKEEMLNCVMYRIIQKGGNKIGPRRAFLFAEEFGRNKDIPIKYSIDYIEPGLNNFLDEYHNQGGSEDLECYEEYFNKSNENIKTIKVRDIQTKIENTPFHQITEKHKTKVRSK